MDIIGEQGDNVHC